MVATVKRSAASSAILRRSSSPAAATAPAAESNAVDEKAGDPVRDQLAHRASGTGDDRRATGHRLDDAVAERLLVDRNDSIGREPVDRGDYRCGDEIAVHEWQEVEPVVDDVELARALEHGRDVQALCDLGVDRRVL